MNRRICAELYREGIVFGIFVITCAIAGIWSMVVGGAISLVFLIAVGMAWVDDNVPSAGLLVATALPAVVGLLVAFH